MLARLTCLFAGLILAFPATAETIAIIGTGDVARALGPEFAAQGHTIIYGSRNPDSDKVRNLLQQSGDGATAMLPKDSVADAEIVVLAVPGTVVADVVNGLGQLDGRIIIDPTNPMREVGDELEHAVATSNGEIIQKLAPGAHVVKAFNTLNWRTMVDPDTSGGPVTIPLAGNDQAAKKTVEKLVLGMGLEAVDVGGIENAHWVEGMLILWINNRIGARDNFDYFLRKTD